MQEASHVDHAVQHDVGLKGPGGVGGAPGRVSLEPEAVVNKKSMRSELTSLSKYLNCEFH